MVIITQETRFDLGARFATAVRGSCRRPRLDPAGLELILRAERPLRLTGCCDLPVRCRSGRVWITAPGQADDIFLHAGQTWTVPTDGLVLIEAEGSASVALGC